MSRAYKDSCLSEVLQFNTECMNQSGSRVCMSEQLVTVGAKVLEQ